MTLSRDEALLAAEKAARFPQLTRGQYPTCSDDYAPTKTEWEEFLQVDTPELAVALARGYRPVSREDIDAVIHDLDRAIWPTDYLDALHFDPLQVSEKLRRYVASLGAVAA